MTRPKAIKTAHGEYTQEAPNAKIEGVVIIKLVINESGVPTDPEVEQSLGKGLDEKAIEAAMQWRFNPALKDGKPVPVFANITIQFWLDDTQPSAIPC